MVSVLEQTMGGKHLMRSLVYLGLAVPIACADLIGPNGERGGSIRPSPDPITSFGPPAAVAGAIVLLVLYLTRSKWLPLLTKKK